MSGAFSGADATGQPRTAWRIIKEWILAQMALIEMLLVTTPWGRWWCYLEVELSDRTYRAVLPHCDKYGSEKRMDNLPVLVVYRDDQAEKNFHLWLVDCGRDR